MNVFGKILYFLSAQMQRPQGYQLFHIISIVTVLLCTAVFCVIFRKASAKTEKTLLMSAWGVLVLFEIYKQLVFSVQFGETVTWEYRWDSFPFQFCSSPLYVLPLAALPKSEKIRDVVRIFLATFSLFAGLAVIFYPDDVFSTYVGVNIQTMNHHGIMVILGVFLGCRLTREGKMKIRLFLKSAVLFAGLVLIALIMNIAAPMVTDMTFNMFFIGPNFPCHLVFFECYLFKCSLPPVFINIHSWIYVGCVPYFLAAPFGVVPWRQKRPNSS